MRILLFQLNYDFCFYIIFVYNIILYILFLFPLLLPASINGKARFSPSPINFISGDNYDSLDKFDCYRYCISYTKFNPTDSSLMKDYYNNYTYSFYQAREEAINYALTLI